MWIAASPPRPPMPGDCRQGAVQYATRSATSRSSRRTSTSTSGRGRERELSAKDFGQDATMIDFGRFGTERQTSPGRRSRSAVKRIMEAFGYREGSADTWPSRATAMSTRACWRHSIGVGTGAQAGRAPPLAQRRRRADKERHPRGAADEREHDRRDELELIPPQSRAAAAALQNIARSAGRALIVANAHPPLQGSQVAKARADRPGSFRLGLARSRRAARATGRPWRCA